MKYGIITETDQIMASFRYFLGRRTILSTSYPNFLLDNWNELGKATKLLIQKEVREYKDQRGHIGDPMIDEPLWMKLLEREA